jgi:hypothetical protein
MTAIRDARRERRVAVDLSATVSMNGRVIAARTRDISRHGLCLISDVQIPGDTELKVKLVLSLGARTTTEPLVLTSRTVWCTALFGKYQVGAKFVNIDHDQKRFLDLFMRFLNGELQPAGMAETDPDDDPREEDRHDKDDPFRP